MHDGKCPKPCNQNHGTREKRTVSSQELFAGGREVIIQHHDMQYRLQITKAGKLILNK